MGPLAVLQVRFLLPTFAAYTYYSFFEWFLIFTDVTFDAITELDFTNLEVNESFDRR